MNIRKLREEDLPAAMQILTLWNMAPLPVSNEVPNPERESLNIENSFVAEEEGVIIGVCSYLHLSSDTAETASLAVDPRIKGKGAGYALQLARFAEMKLKGYRWVHTETDRAETIDWYIRKFGYQIVGTNPKKHSFSLANVDHWTVLKLDLNNFTVPDEI